MAELAAYTARPCDGRLRELVAALNADPGVLNHPFWGQRGIGRARHTAAQQDLIRVCAGRIHAMELNGLRSWDENQLRIGPLWTSACLWSPVVTGTVASRTQSST